MSRDKENSAETSPGSNQLKRSLSLTMLVFYGVGTILGLGIYVLVGKISGEAGMLAPFAFLMAGILAAFTGLSYGELAARIPKSAGEVNYVEAAFGKAGLSKLTGWLIVFSAIVSTATVVNGYVGYIQIFVHWPSWLIICLFTILLGSVAVWGIKESAWLIGVVTVVELIGILMVIFVGADYLKELPERWQELIPGFNAADWQSITGGVFLAFFAFIGFEDLVNISEEAKNPRKDMPKAIIISLIILTVLYILVAVIAGFALEPEVLGRSDAPLADVVRQKGEVYTKSIGLISLVAIINGVLVQIIMCSRVLYGMAEAKMAPGIFHILHSRTRTPVWSTLFTVGVILVLALNFQLESLARATNYILLTVFVLVNLSLMVIKKKKPPATGVVQRPIWVPAIGFLFSLVLIVLEILSAVKTVIH